MRGTITPVAVAVGAVGVVVSVGGSVVVTMVAIGDQLLLQPSKTRLSSLPWPKHSSVYS